jgi:hypothetical protein
LKLPPTAARWLNECPRMSDSPPELPPQRDSASRPEPPAGRTGWYRYAGMGLELGGAIVGLTLAGVWVDHAFGTGPTGTIVGALLGVIGGMYNFIREALRLSAPPPRERDSHDP